MTKCVGAAERTIFQCSMQADAEEESGPVVIEK